jgi:hypothetical protein
MNTPHVTESESDIGQIGFTLPIRPRPFSDEAANGYVIRVAAENGYGSPRQLRTAYGDGTDANVFNVFCNSVKLSETEESSLFGPLPSYWGEQSLPNNLASSDFNHNVMRWCPLCLKDSSYLRGCWSLKLCCACSFHGCLLCDRCPQCGEDQRLERVEIRQCLCGARLDTSQVIPASVSLLRLNDAIMSSAVHNRMTADFPEIDALGWQRLVRYLGQFNEYSQPSRPGQIAGLHSLETALPIVTNTAELMDDWPKNFMRVLATIEKREVASTSIRRSFGRIYHVLYADLQSECFQFLRDAFEDYLHRNWWGTVCKRNRSFKPETILTHPRITVKQAALRSGVTPALIHHLSTANLVAYKKVMLPSKRQVRAIHQGDVAQISAIAKKGMNLTEASRFLGISKGRVKELMVAGLIVPLVSRFHTDAASWLISKQDLAKLSFRTQAVRSQMEKVSLKHIAKFWRLRENEFANLVRALVNKELVPRNNQSVIRCLGEVLLSHDEAYNWLNSQRVKVEGSLSVDQAAQVLGVKQQVAYELVRSGLLEATVDQALGRRISVGSIKNFQETYISLAESAKILEQSPKKILKAIEAVPVCGPSINGDRQYFFRRSEINIEEFLDEPR